MEGAVAAKAGKEDDSNGREDREGGQAVNSSDSSNSGDSM